MANPIAAAATDSLYSGFFNLVRRDVVLQQTLIVERTAMRWNVANCRRTKSLWGYRRAIQTGDGPEFYRWTFGGIGHILIEPEKPIENVVREF